MIAFTKIAPLWKDRILGFSISASKARQHDAPHRHVLLYGPPGTGKTMVKIIILFVCCLI